MSSASTGVRIVARALPGSGGSAARALASAACFAAWRAAHGAAPRSPSFRLSGVPSSLPAAAAPAFAGLAAALPLATTGCASSIASWIVKERNHQGDVALVHGNYPDASVAYQLALKIDPANKHARDGLITVQIRLAQTFFAASKFDDAIDALAVASRYSPSDERVQSLRGEIEQAEIKRDIVVSNYPSYKVTGASIRRIPLGSSRRAIARVAIGSPVVMSANRLPGLSLAASPPSPVTSTGRPSTGADGRSSTRTGSAPRATSLRRLA